MGIDYDSVLIVGWQVEYAEAAAFLAKYGVHCFLDTGCWGNRDALPLQAELTIVKCAPYLDCNVDDYNYYLTLDETRFHSLTEFLTIVQRVDWEAARKIAVQLRAEDKPACIFSTAHIW